ncbi:hypothetical protein Mpsy_0182 [Methanolobus psychrophilus R15]|nr:hypothetical protein Mpsy_0182 [Methanolobus psychrophilus R15]
MNQLKEISDIFSHILENRYKGYDLEIPLFRLEEIISNNNFDYTCKSLTLDNVQTLATRDFEFFLRLMNWTIKNSTICLSYFFLESALRLIKKECDGKVILLLNNGDNNAWKQLFNNCLWIIIQNRLTDEVDISTFKVDSPANIFIGINSKLIIPIDFLGKNKVDILDLLNDKYMQSLLYQSSDLSNIELCLTISKLNSVYQCYTKSNICDIMNMTYTQDNSEHYLLEIILNPNRYDELIFEKYGYLFFPLIRNVVVEDGKIDLQNEGYGSLENCNFGIYYKNKSIFNREIDIKNGGHCNICIDDNLKSEILNIEANEKLDFCFEFHKFNQAYKFYIIRKVWLIKEGIHKKVGTSMNIQNINNYGNMAIGDHASVSHSKVTQINLNDEQKQELIGKLNTIIENVDNLDANANEKSQIKTKIKEALDETKKVNSNISLIGNLIQESGILLKNVAKTPVLIEALSYIRTLFGN